MTPAPELPPTLARLGERLEHAFEQREARDRALRRRRQRRWVAASVAAALAVGPVAVATRPLWEPNGNGGASRAAVVTRGTSAGQSWRLSAYGAGDRLCLRLSITGGLSSQTTACSPAMAAGKLDARVVPLAGRTYVFGQAPTAAARVQAELPGRPASSVATFSAPAKLREEAGLSGEQRFYLIIVNAKVEPEDQLQLKALAVGGRILAQYP
jgi:hypothetical protein